MNDNQLQINLYPLSGKCSEADAAKLLSEMISKTIPSAAKGTIDNFIWSKYSFWKSFGYRYSVSCRFA